MPTAVREWVPYGTPQNPVRLPSQGGDLPEWDSVLIGNVQVPIEGVPRYEKHLKSDKKHGPGQDNQAITAKGVKPAPIHITLKLWVDVLTGTNYLDLYRALLPLLMPPRYDRRYAVPVYHPVLEAFGVTSIVFTKVPTPQHVGNLVFHAELEGDNAADVKNGTSTKEIAKPNVNALVANPPILTGRTQMGQPVSLVIPTATQQGQAVAKTWTSLLNTPASRSSSP